jgi:ATP-dependent exoDNAse (exonuclease V) alpha subunit
MAIYHLNAKIFGRSNGRSAVAAAAYRSGEKLENVQTGDKWDFTRKDGIYKSGIEYPDNSPEWVKDRETLWNEVERKENRINSQFSREYDIALPSELSKDENEKLLKDFIKDNFTKRGIVADWAIHEPSKEGDEKNIHAHVMTTLRQVDQNGWSNNKDREGNQKEHLENIRESWAKTVNRELERKGLDERIDHRTLAEQGIERIPQQHMGVVATAMERSGKEPDRKRIEEIQNQEIEIDQSIISQEQKELEYIAYAENALVNPEAYKSVQMFTTNEENKKHNEITKTAIEMTFKDRLEAGEKMRNEMIKQYQSNPDKNLHEKGVKVERKLKEVREVLEEGDPQKLLDYSRKECARVPELNKEIEKKKEILKNQNKDIPLENLRKDINDIERIRREQKRQRELENEKGRSI